MATTTGEFPSHDHPQPRAAHTSWPLTSTMTPLGALPTAPACARVHIRSTLTVWDMAMLADAAELVISELVTNAVRASTDERGHPRYANGRMPVIHVRMLADGVRLLLEVWDMAPALPVVRHAADDDEAGRGLQLVEALAYRWNWQTVPSWPGKCVWAELRRLLII